MLNLLTKSSLNYYLPPHKTGNQVKARSVLERARLKNPASPELWKRAIELEKRVSGNEIADRLLSRAMQECAASGSLWAEAIECASRPARKVLFRRLKI